MADERPELTTAPLDAESVRGAVIVGGLLLLLSFGRSCDTAQHDVPEAGAGEVVWIATFNGL